MLSICVVAPPSTCKGNQWWLFLSFQFISIFPKAFPPQPSALLFCPSPLHVSQVWTISLTASTTRLLHSIPGRCLTDSLATAHKAASEGQIPLQKNQELAKKIFFRWHANRLPSCQPSTTLSLYPGQRNFHRECSWQPNLQHPTLISFLKYIQPLTPWGRKMQHCHFQHAPQRLSVAGSNSS